MNAARLGLKAEAPIQAPSTAGAPASRPSPPGASRVAPRPAVALRHRRDDREPLGGVVQREADDQRGAQRERADRVGRADRQPLAQVVQADAERHEEGEPPRRPRPLRRRRRLWRPRSHASTPTSAEIGDRRARGTRAPRRRRPAAPVPANSVPSSSASTPEEGEQAERERQQELHPARVDRRGSTAARACRSPPGSRPRRARPAPSARRSRASASGVSAATSIECVDRAAGGGDQRDLVGLALDPRVVERHRARPPRRADVVVWSG